MISSALGALVIAGNSAPEMKLRKVVYIF